MANTADATEPCGYCGMCHTTKCPMVRAIEYFEDGRIKRVEFITPLPIGPLPIDIGKTQFGEPPYPITSLTGGSVSCETKRVMSWG